MTVVIVVGVWAAIGIVTGLVEARRGHWDKTWVLGAVLGPFSIPVALAGRRREATAAPMVLRGDGAGSGATDVLVGVDGSAASAAAARTAARLFGAGVGRLALATVVDYDVAEPHADSVMYPEPWDEEHTARQQLESASADVATDVGFTPTTVLLAGRPADALEAYALAEGYDVLVTGCRGRGLAKAVFGSCASQLASGTQVPVLLVSDTGPVSAGQDPAVGRAHRG